MAETPATPKKPLDRNKPFRRINNDEALARIKTPPDGDGKAAGCHVPSDIPNVEEEFRKFLDKNLPLPIISFLDDVEKIVKTVKQVIDSIIAALVVLAFFLGGGFGTPALLTAIAAFADALLSALDTIIDIIKDAIKGFFDNIGRETLKRALRAIPQWVPVKVGGANHVAAADQIIEMEGVTTRSFGNPIDVPFFQYHRWFDWNIQVAPEADYVNARSPAKNPPDTSELQGSEQPITKNDSFEIQLDPGALWAPAKAARFDSGIPEGEMEAFDGPYLLADWVWPQAGSYVWAAGRWVYDCTRVTKDDPPKMVAMINPAKAVATARWGAAKLPGQAHDLAVPVIEFMFIANKKGGYIDFSAIDDQDYEFILDLPPGPADASPYPVGHTGQVPDNTIVLRSLLLKKVSPLLGTDAQLIQPKIEPIFGEDAGKGPQQVKVTVPLKSAKKPSSASSAGFILTLGWYDADGSQADKVRVCTLTLDHFSGRKQVRDDGINTLRKKFKHLEDDLRKLLLDKIDNLELPLPSVVKTILKGLGIPGFKIKDIPPLQSALHSVVNTIIDKLFELLSSVTSEQEEWLLHFGMNGVWLNLYDDHVSGKGKPLKRTIQLGPMALGEEDELKVTMSGSQVNPVGDFMRTAHLRRVLTKNNTELTWSQICNADAQTHKDLVFQYVLKLMFNPASGQLMLGIDNDPLGMVDPHAGGGCAAANKNPVAMKGATVGSSSVSYSANFARAAGEQYVLVEDASKCDYTISGTLEIAKQSSSSSSASSSGVDA